MEEKTNDIEKLLSLVKTGTKENIDLSFKLAKSQKIDLETSTREYFALNWIEKQKFKSSKKILSSKKIQTKLFHLLNMNDLSFHKVTTFPEELKNLPSLQTLCFYSSNIPKIPTYIQSFNQLVELEFYGCKLEEIPQEIGTLSNLEYLNLVDNKLKEIPQEIGNLSKLVELCLNNNKLEILPSTIGKLEKLETLILEENQLKKLPKEIGNLKKLEILTLESNNIKMLPKEIEELPSLLHEEFTYDEIMEMSDNFRAQVSIYDEYYDDIFE